MVFFFAVTISCAAQNKRSSISGAWDECIREIISQEVQRHYKSEELTHEKNIYLWFSLNDVLAEFLKKNTNIKYHPANSMELSEFEWQMLFNHTEINHLLNQLSNPICEIGQIKFPENFVVSNPKKEKEKINGNGLLSAEYHNKTRFFLSQPIILSNKKYALIAYSTGIINSTQGGIHLYKKINGKWMFYKRLKGWIS
jgi:hypothetical protein